ncbi:fumarylacetoacetate hydrolase family protein [Aneurinibacillus sp. BA2021]|nr:fumarylacetoacetate hydrolase family protein [Aneurinibacillus sp. BA2021]
MLLTDTVEAIAEELFAAEAEGREVEMFANRYPELDATLAYSVQERLIEMKCERQKTYIRGRKLGLTSIAKQKMMGVHEPLYGVLLGDMELVSHEPISLQPFIHAKIEPEIAFVFDRDMKGPVSVPDVLAATAYVLPAFEIIDSRYRDFKFTLADVIADNASSSRFILGDRLVKPSALDLRVTGVVCKRNGQVIATSTGAAVMGHPARAVAWMINKLTERGQCVKAGEVVLSGALTEAFRIEENDVFSVGFDGLGSVQAVFTT